MSVTMKEAAEQLDGNQYRKEGSLELFAAMKTAGLVAVFGASDDLMEFRGAEDDEIGAYDGAYANFSRNGLIHGRRESDKINTSVIHALWCPDGIDTAWQMKTDLPHEIFHIMEDDDLYCIGLVFSLKDIPE